MRTPALKKKRTSLDGHSDEIASPDKDVEGDDNGHVGASPALNEKRTLSDMYEGLVGPDLGRKLPVGCAKLKNLPPHLGCWVLPLTAVKMRVRGTQLLLPSMLGHSQTAN